MSKAYCTYISDMLAPWGIVKARAMFGGFGLYRDSQIFAIIVDDTLYFKVGKSNKKDYEEAYMEPFSYETKNGTRVAMSYWSVPPAVLDDEEALAAWAQKAYEEGLASQK